MNGIERLARLERRAPSTIAHRCGGNWTAHKRLRQGRHLKPETVERMLDELIRQWPEGVSLPFSPGDA